MVRTENTFGSFVSLANDALHFVVDLNRRGFAVVAMLGDLAAQEDLFFFLAESQRAQFAHAKLADHLAGQFRRALNVIAGAGAHLVQENLFGDDGHPS